MNDHRLVAIEFFHHSGLVFATVESHIENYEGDATATITVKVPITPGPNDTLESITDDALRRARELSRPNRTSSA